MHYPATAIIVNILLGVALVAATTSRAQEVEVPTFETSVQSMIVSSYVDTNGDELSNSAAAQTELIISHKSGLYLYVFQSSSLDFELNNSYADEVDVGLGWAGSLSTFELDAGIFYVDEPKLAHFGAGDIIYAYGKLSFEVAKNWTASGTYEGFWPLENSGFHGGHLFALGVGRTVDIIDGKLTLSGTGEVVYDDGTFVNDDGFLLRAAASLEWKVADHLSVMPLQLKAYLPMTVEDDREPRVVFGTGLILRF